MAVVSQTLSADGSTTGWQIQGDGLSPRAAALTLEGSFGGGSAQIEIAHEDVAGSYVPLLDGAGAVVSYAVEGGIGLDLPIGTWVRVTLTGSTTPTLNVRLWRSGDIPIA